MKWWDQDAMIFVFWMLSFKPTFSLSSFTFIKRLFSSSSLSAIRVVSSAYLRLLIFLPAILLLYYFYNVLEFWTFGFGTNEFILRNERDGHAKIPKKLILLFLLCSWQLVPNVNVTLSWLCYCDDVCDGELREGGDHVLVCAARLCRCCLVAKSRLFVTLWTVAHQASLSMGFPRQEYWNRLLFPSPGDLLKPEIKPLSP